MRLAMMTALLFVLLTSHSEAFAAEPTHLHSRCGIRHTDEGTYQLYADGKPFGFRWSIHELAQGEGLMQALDALTDGNCSARGYLDLRQAHSAEGSRCSFAVRDDDHAMFYLDDQPFSVWIRWDQAAVFTALRAALDAAAQGACSEHGWTQRP